MASNSSENEVVSNKTETDILTATKNVNLTLGSTKCT